MILVYAAGKLRKHRIRSMVGDRVTVEMTPYDLSRGRLIFRHRDGPPAAPGARRPARALQAAPMSDAGPHRVVIKCPATGAVVSAVLRLRSSAFEQLSGEHSFRCGRWKRVGAGGRVAVATE